MRKGLSFQFSRSLISRIRMPRRIRPRLLLRIGENTLEFRTTSFKDLLEVLDLLYR
jgi:hypothetical protein